MVEYADGQTRLQSDLFKTPHVAPVVSPVHVGGGAAAVMQQELKGARSSHGPKPPAPRGGLWQFVDTLYLIRRIQVEEGWRALYKGLGPSLGGIIPAR